MGSDTLGTAQTTSVEAEVTTFATIAAVALIAFLVAILLVRVVRHLRAQAPARELERRFGLSLPAGLVVSRRATPGVHNTYSLEFPAWKVRCADGTHDGRSNDYGVDWGTCHLDVDSYEVEGTDPSALLGLVSQLRARGCVIDPCDLELERIRHLEVDLAVKRRLRSAADVWRAFGSDPTGFERLVAELLQTDDLTASLTPPTNDGGYDIVLTCVGRPDLTCVVECKCFRPDNSVGRPLVQKLVGANQGPTGARAARMLFVTTSSFSQEAKTYASECGVDLVDGEGLARMLERSFDRTSGGEVTTPAAGTWFLSAEDLATHYPPDWFDAKTAARRDA